MNRKMHILKFRQKQIPDDWVSDTAGNYVAKFEEVSAGLPTCFCPLPDSAETRDMPLA
jgi:hypothetical protein